MKVPNKEDKKVKNKTLTTVLIILGVVFLGVFAFSGYKLYSILHGYAVAKAEYNNMSSQFVSEQAAAPEEAKSEEEKVPVEYSPINVNFDALKEQCKDIVGWIYCKDTVIDYPVVQGIDNDYYLHRFMDGSYNANGTIFLDFAGNRDLSCRNNIIYGHHMNDGSMFASLTNYSKQEYYEEHPVMYLNTPDCDYKLEIFSAYITPYDSYTYTYAFTDESVYAAYLNQVKAWSLIETDVDVTDEDRIVTLSTCTYEYENARFVVQAKLVPIGDGTMPEAAG